MIGKLRFKTSMFEGVLDGGDDTVFISDDKFKKFMEDIDAVVRNTPEPVPVVEYVDEDETFVDNNSEEESVNENFADGSQVDDNPTFDDSIENDTVCKDTIDDESERKNNVASNECYTHPNSSRKPSEDGIEKRYGSSSTRSPKQLITEGVSFLSGLADTLKSPEATQQLIDNIVEVDSETGQTNLKIPVANKETVSNVLQLLGKLFG